MALDGLKIDGTGGIVGDDDIASELGLTPASYDQLEKEISTVLSPSEHALRYKIANILVTHLTHEERMCALHMFFDAKVAPCSGEKLCRLQKKVRRKLRGLPEAEVQALWHLL